MKLFAASDCYTLALHRENESVSKRSCWCSSLHHADAFYHTTPTRSSLFSRGEFHCGVSHHSSTNTVYITNCVSCGCSFCHLQSHSFNPKLLLLRLLRYSFTTRIPRRRIESKS